MNGINQNRIKLSQLRTLVAVAEHGNFSEAGLYLEISQSAVSHAIATLEEELGVPLLARGRHGANLTPAGEGVISYARQVLELLDGMVEEANSHRGLKGGQVRVGAFRSVATHVLPELVAQFRSRFPDIAVTLIEYFDALEVERDLRAGKIDVGFLDLPNSEEFETCEILRDEYVALLPPTAKVSCPQLTWKQLAAYQLIFETPGNACYVKLRNYLQSCGISLPIAYEIREDSTRVRMVAQGLGAAILFRLAALPIPPEVKVCHLPVPLERIVGAAVLADALHPPAVYAFVEMLKETRLAAAS
jgi:DNA-binding transcriptional LysR family regulator